MTSNQKNILIDGYNLGLEKGTGVATYARNLSYEIHELGHKVSVLYGNRGSYNRDELLHEIAFFDGPVEQPRFLEIFERAKQAIRGPLSYSAKQVPITGKVVSRTFASRLPYFDAIYNSNEVFKNAQGAFWMWQRPVNIRMPEQPDLAHWTYPLPVAIKGRPNIYTMHDLVPLKLPYTTLDNKRRYLKLMRLLGRRADHIVTVSENSKRDLVELVGIPEEKITNTYQSVQIPAKYRDKPEEQVAREVEGVTGFPHKGYFLFWGSLEPKKNIGRMIESYLASQVETPLVIIGAQAWKAERELALLNEGRVEIWDNGSMAEIRGITGPERRRGARKHIIRLDYVPFSLLVSLIRGAKAALFPSLYEGFGLPALEAMLLGTPVICSNTSSLPEVVGDAAMTVDPYDPQALTAAIRAIDADGGLREDLARRGMVQAAEYSPANYRDRLQAVYSRFL
ncbi:glycosyltransferase family 4 protein [Qipengyuania soli]|uniref:Glycosyltransferase family 4 protein n=1 Tax=Qipengyuania soli TaxID=2782568 RepID=A0A7S8IUG9_9SPHN|nr:glycosyltransferase family 1 protein [Qipengyuania soli]QPC97726.1 glycosyltransferase family 4 protein [Qipengyuania soli]